MTTVYKVVRVIAEAGQEKRMSVFPDINTVSRPNCFILEYKEGIKTVPIYANSKLFAFSDFSFAELWTYPKERCFGSPVEIWEGEAEVDSCASALECASAIGDKESFEDFWIAVDPVVQEMKARLAFLDEQQPFSSPSNLQISSSSPSVLRKFFKIEIEEQWMPQILNRMFPFAMMQPPHKTVLCDSITLQKVVRTVE